MSRTLSGLFLVGALNRPRREKGRIGKIAGPSPSKSGKSRKNRESPKKDKKRQKRKDKSRSGNPPVLKPPRLAALELVFMGHRTILARYVAKFGIAQVRLCETKSQDGVSHHSGRALTLRHLLPVQPSLSSRFQKNA